MGHERRDPSGRWRADASRAEAGRARGPASDEAARSAGGQGPGGRPAALRAVRDDDGPGCCLPPLGIETPSAGSSSAPSPAGRPRALEAAARPARR